MFEQCDITCHQGGGGKTNNLPEREVPRHDSEYDPQRLVGVKAFACIVLMISSCMDVSAFWA